MQHRKQSMAHPGREPRLPDIFSNSLAVIQRISLFNQFMTVIDKT